MTRKTMTGRRWHRRSSTQKYVQGGLGSIELLLIPDAKRGGGKVRDLYSFRLCLSVAEKQEEGLLLKACRGMIVLHFQGLCR